MQSFRYFRQVKHPFFLLKRQKSADAWLRRRGLTSVVHVRRGDKPEDGSPVVPVEYYERALARLGHSRVAVCADDVAWVRRRRVFQNASVSTDADPGFDMAILAGATDAVIIGIGTFAWWGAYLSRVRTVHCYKTMYPDDDREYSASGYIPHGMPGQGEWIG